MPAGELLTRRAARARLKVARARSAFGLPGAAVAVLGLMHRAVVLLGRTALTPFRLLSELATDAWLGVDTRGKADSVSTLADIALGGDPNDYEPLGLLSWMRLFSAVPVDPSRTTFLDLGAGRGRTLILAARMGFRQVIGVELDERLARDAEANIARWSSRGHTRRRGQQISAVRADAAEFPWPQGPLVVSLFNPFGAQTLRRVLARASTQERAAGEQVYIAYFNPVHLNVFEEFPELVRHDTGVDWALYRLDVAGRSA